MASTPFQPPRYTETHHYIFDRRSGEILATETRWTDEGAEGGDRIDVNLVRHVAEDGGRTVQDVDVLRVTERPPRGRLRVDVAARKLLAAELPGDREIVRPPKLERP